MLRSRRTIVVVLLSVVIAAIVLEFGSCAAFVVIFRLFFDDVPVGPARELAWTEQGAGALLPGGGAGALAVGGWLLQRQAILTRRSSRGITRSTRSASWFADLVDGIDSARHALLSPSWRLIGAVGYLAFDLAALGASFAASGRSVPVAPLVLGYLIGYLANLIPVPGGFGVLGGGLAGALVVYGAPLTQATAAVIVYHVIAFWIPSLGGVAGYALLQRRGRSRREPLHQVGLVERHTTSATLAS
ncbi:MAG: lysylphosphatidylglycerol synthase domain-containing protein [Solirubrobacteraceae bacterium]